MKYAPTDSELVEFSTMPKEERYIYTLTRIVESEEVWGLTESRGWVLSDENEQSSLPIWPYKAFALPDINDDWKNAQPAALSLEHFIFNTSQLLIDNNIMVNVASTLHQPGLLVEAKEFFTTLENLLESGEYFMEG